MSEEIITETNRETATDHEYGGAQIQVLEGLEAVRKRPGMYIGSTGPSGLHHLVYEIVDNSIDEALAGYCTHIEVTIKPGNIIEVSDNGRGIPVDIQPKLGIPAVTVVYTVLHAGGKFGGEDSGYKVAGGLHGVGASVVNALSEWLVVHVRRDGAEYEQSFKRGKPDGDLKKIGVAASTGTTVTFKPDPEMFTETTEYDYEILLKRLREESFLNAGVRITLTDERPESIEKNDGVPPQESMCYEGGVRSFVQYLHEKRDLTPLHPQVIYMKGEANGAVAEVALQYCDSYNELSSWGKYMVDLHQNAQFAYQDSSSKIMQNYSVDLWYSPRLWYSVTNGKTYTYPSTAMINDSVSAKDYFEGLESYWTPSVWKNKFQNV